MHKHLKSGRICAWLIGLVALAMGAQASAAPWFKVETEHFIFYTNGPEARARSYASKIESFRYLSLLMLGADPADARASVKFEIYLLKNQEQIQLVRPGLSKNVAGVYFPCVEGSSAYSSLSVSQNDNGTDPGLAVLFHEYSHHIMYQYAKMYYPQWFVEGFAEYLGTAYVQPNAVTLGESDQGRSYVLSQDRWIDFEKVLKPAFKSTGDKTNDQWMIQSFYAQSWLLAHYMLSDTARTQKFNAYFARVGAGEDAIAAFEPATGIAVDKLSAILKRYREKLPVLKVKIKDMPESSVQVTPMPDTTDAYLLNASLLKTCASGDFGKSLLEQLKGQKHALTGQVAYRRALDRAEILFGDPKAAATDLESLVVADDSDFEAHYLLGRAYMKQAYALTGNAQFDFIDKAKPEFLKAYRLKKLDAPNLYYLALSMASEGINKNVVNAAQGARALAPGVADYGFYEAYVDLESGDRARAIAALTPLGSNPHDPERAEKVRQAIEAIKAGKTTREVMQIMNAPIGTK